MGVIAKNKKALFNYEVIETLETGIALTGSEMKPIRKGEVNLAGSYVAVDSESRLVARDIHIKEYFQASYNNHTARRHRYLLAHRKEINRLASSLKIKGMTLIPLELYFSGKRVKLRIGLCRGKKIHDKRQSIKEKEAKREVAAVMKHKRLS